jgi:hypothetical protein
VASRNVAVRRSRNVRVCTVRMCRLGTKYKERGINVEGVCARAALDERRANDSRVAWCWEE